ncbi:hypothetical protein ACFT5B_08600 [Luteimicrobium sp. NPDC057192]|uniref:hypothetical protein n=1 Tax=Luteimicrobium sp. NPDC057192 TaxID=3346042 RepID=UPI00362D5E9F
MRASQVVGAVAVLAAGSMLAGCTIALHGTPAQPTPATTTWHVSWPAMHVTVGPEDLTEESAAAEGHLADARRALDTCRSRHESGSADGADPCAAERDALGLARAETWIAHDDATRRTEGAYLLICDDGSLVDPEDGYAACPDDAHP